MPRKELNYDKTYFYKIVCKDLNIKDCYVGHTLNFKTESQHTKELVIMRMTENTLILMFINL